MSIFYVCDNCQDYSPESCGRSDPAELRIAPSGAWVCEECWIELGMSAAEWDSAASPPRHEPVSVSTTPPAATAREYTDALLRRLIDLTWGEAFEDQSVPSRKIQDRLIARALSGATREGGA